jgi:hypothetical protein
MKRAITTRRDHGDDQLNVRRRHRPDPADPFECAAHRKADQDEDERFENEDENLPH